MTRNSILRIIALAVMLASLATSSLVNNSQPQATEYFFAPQSQIYSARRVSAPSNNELQQLRSKIGSASRFLDTFWQRTFSAYRRRYTSPRVYASGSSAFYRSQTHSIHFDPAFFVRQMRAAAEQSQTDGDFAPITILAHEWGHSVQAQLGRLRGQTIRMELEADCLAGAFAKAARDAGVLDQGDLDEATYTFFSGRDRTGTPSYHRGAHGTGTQRVNSFLNGLKGGVAACGCF
ncbi:MAG: neutral zinc metallopeptidase [Blastocatellia bacterium]|nr:neutral zinc metallopeptidase [Blastocatellia bacterium]